MIWLPPPNLGMGYSERKKDTSVNVVLLSCVERDRVAFCDDTYNIIESRARAYTRSTTVLLTLYRSKVNKEILQIVLLYSLVVKLLFGMRKLPKLVSDHVLRDEHRRIFLPVVYQETDPI